MFNYFHKKIQADSPVLVSLVIFFYKFFLVMVVYTYSEDNVDPKITISVLSDKIPDLPDNQLTVSTILSLSPDKEMEAENGNKHKPKNTKILKPKLS